MNKKAALLHWIVFGVIASIALFLILSKSFTISSQTKGQWQIDFLQKYVYKAETDLLQLDGEVQTMMQEIIITLAGKGGFTTVPSCGEYEEISLWNKGEQWCFPQVKEEARKLLFPQLKMKSVFTKLQESDITVEDNFVFGKGPVKRLKSQSGYTQQYMYHYDFNTPLGYSFAEYSSLAEEVQKLIADCRNMRNLPLCLEERPVHWKLCKGEIVGRIISFCIDSPAQYFVGEEMLDYKLALDFTPTTPFEVEGLTVTKEGNTFEIHFTADTGVEEYKIYYTDWSAVAGKSGKPEVVFQDFTTSFGNFKKEITFEQPGTQNCLAGAENQARLCDTIMTYILQDSQLTEGKEYYFAVTAVIGNTESEIKEFVKA